MDPCVGAPSGERKVSLTFCRNSAVDATQSRALESRRSLPPVCGVDSALGCARRGFSDIGCWIIVSSRSFAVQKPFFAKL